MIALALVARGTTVLDETHHDDHARFLPAAETILHKVPDAGKLSYAFEDWLFHVVSRSGTVYLAVASADAGRRMPFAFLSELEKKYTEGDNETLVALVRDFNERPDSDPVRQAQAELAGVKDIMTQNVEQILSRGERIQLLVDRTDNAAHQSQAFRRRAVGIRRQMWWKNAKVLALSGFCGIVFLFILYNMLS